MMTVTQKQILGTALNQNECHALAKSTHLVSWMHTHTHAIGFECVTQFDLHSSSKKKKKIKTYFYMLFFFAVSVQWPGE